MKPQSPLRSRHRLQLAFDAGHLNERGTDVALWDYAHYAETLLGHRSRILCPANSDLSAFDKFRRRFSVFLYDDPRDCQAALRDVDVYYRIVHGADFGEELLRPPEGRLVLHAVFEASAPRGDVYAAVSDWVACHRGTEGLEIPVVPHMISLPQVAGDLRSELGIPPEAVVLGRHGGPMTFDLPFVHVEVAAAVQRRPELHFVFLNTAPFCPPHPRIHHLPTTTDLERKVRFIQSCDGMLHGRSDGESFGLSVGEFSVLNKPVITWLGGSDRHHIDVLGSKGIYYRDGAELATILDKFEAKPGIYDAFSERFSPSAVMQRFAEVFLAETPAKRIATPCSR
ncbi:MAG: hypothetical protein CSA62_13270 [Planctomycetota bacterium]|nr:MAG: hypothetical protein CSA62_13270 [Planctomycetota bacterium]